MSLTQLPVRSAPVLDSNKKTALTLFTAAQQNLDELRTRTLSSPAQYELASIAIAQIARAAQLLHGQEPTPVNDPAGLLQSMQTTLGISSAKLAKIQQLHSTRLHLARHGGQVSKTATKACITEAELLISLLGDKLEDIRHWRIL